MIISLKWINEFVDINEYLTNPQGLADLLTRAGLEVEEIKNLSQDFKNVVVGHIKVKDKHPNADKLSLCQVEIGQGQVSQIVCGAQNHKQGDKVVVALPGAVLPGNFAIKKSKIRDVESLGMLCSLKELGLASESEGIEILPSEATVGMSYAEYAGYDDITFELKVTPNRADCLSHYGLAREIGCLLNRPVKKPEVQKNFSKGSTKSKVQLKVENTDLCPRYCGRYISGVKVGPSPSWLQKRLTAIGQNSINNVVDVTNYVMLEMGQPLHAFDADQIAGSSIVIRTAKKDEKFKTLKEQDITLSGEELLICDAEKPVALAGVIGGLNSGVTEATKNIFLESAYFQPVSVRKSSRSHGLETDSAYRFSRGVDPSSTSEIMDRACYLILQVAGKLATDLSGDSKSIEAFSDAHDVYPQPVTKNPIAISLQTISDRLGYPAKAELFVQYMKGLQCEITGDEKSYKVTPPLFRFDLSDEMDLVEEYARLHGYEHIQESLPAFDQMPAKHDFFYEQSQSISSLMRAEGFSQAFNYAFTSKNGESKFAGDLASISMTGLDLSGNYIDLLNPLNEELNVMRRTLSYGLWKNLTNNVHAGNSFGQLFEVGGVFSKSEGSYQESSRLSLISWGSFIGLYPLQTPNLLQIKNTIEKLLAHYQITAFTWIQSNGDHDKSAPEFLHKGQWATLNVEGKNIGFIGTLHPALLAEEKVRVPVALGEVHLEKLLKGQPRPRKFKSLSGFQPVERDFAFVMDTDKPAGDLLKEIKKAASANLKDLIVFDLYEGDKLPTGKKSVAVKVILQSFENPLSESEISTISQKIVETAGKSVGATLR